MSTARLEDEIRELEKQVEELRAAKPAHDMELLLLEDALDEKRAALARARRGAPSPNPEGQER